MSFDPLSLQILVISLKRSLDRRRKVEQELQKVPFTWAFLDAVDGSALTGPPPEYRSSKVKLLQGYELTPNEIGCYLSHKEAWKTCVGKNIPTLIFEDDFVLSPEFENVMHSLLCNEASWNFVRLQGLYEVPFQEVVQIDGIHLVKNTGDAVGATAYLLKPQVAKSLLEAAENIYEPVDHFLEHHQNQFNPKGKRTMAKHYHGERRRKVFKPISPPSTTALQPLEPLSPDWQLYQQPSTVDDPSSWDLFAKLNQVKPMEVIVQTQREYRHLSGALTQQQQTQSISVTQETVKSRQTSTPAPTMTFHGPATIYIGYPPKATQ